MNDLIAEKDCWVVVHDNTSIAYFFEILVGYQITSGLPEMEIFFRRSVAVELMRDFDRWFEVDPLNLNSADLTSLTLLSGVGDMLAMSIIQSRPYETLEQVAEKVAGITEATIASWGDHAYVGDQP